MKLTGVGGSKGPVGTQRKKAASRSSDGVFRQTLEEAAATGEAEGLVGTSALGSVDSILALQEMPDATDGRSRGRMRRYGEDLLDQLDGIRHGLLAGTMSKDRLVDLAQRVRAQKERSDDPRLNDIIEEIELRVEVEIAKLTRDGRR